MYLKPLNDLLVNLSEHPLPRAPKRERSELKTALILNYPQIL